MRLVVHPSLADLAGEDRARFERTLRKKASKFITHSLLLLIITGVFNVARGVGEGLTEEIQTQYWVLFLIKLVLAFALIAIAVMSFAPSEALEKFQQKRPFWMMVNIALGFAVVLISAYIRLLPRV